ncbi:hypothetical protein AKJ62_04435 [candidate division MSBL1 archaeon SCGC-AAA259D14]|nr:hypothetical protein AKJ62_04435 [candidate division MSBL1 archaeon SCGC-AAA259D14]
MRSSYSPNIKERKDESCALFTPGREMLVQAEHIPVHLPDITLIKPVHGEGTLLGFAVNRAHHGDIGGETPGSMPGHANTPENFSTFPHRLLVDNWIQKLISFHLPITIRIQYEHPLRLQGKSSEEPHV